MQFRIEVKPENRNDSWWEDYNKPEVIDQDTADRAGKALVQYFNDTLRPGESRRLFLRASLEKNSSSEPHKWSKPHYSIGTWAHV